MPYFVSVEPVNFCQLQCPECSVGQHRQENPATLSIDLFACLLEQVKQHVWVMQFYFQGEPLLCHELPAMIRLAHREGIYTILSTNAQALSFPLAQELVQSGLNRIIVSMDGLSQVSYASYRKGGQVEKVYDALHFLQDAKQQANSSMCIEMQCLRLKSNEHEWQQMRRIYRTLGADKLTFKTAQLGQYAEGNPLMPSDERYSRYYRKKDGRYYPKNRHNGLCRRLFMGCVMDVSGTILPCCFDKDREYVFGSLLQSSFRDCWNSDKAHLFRQRVLTNRAKIPICTNCTE